MNTAVRTGGLAVIAVIALCFVFALPAVSSAQEIAAVQTRQLLPPNGTSCVPLSVSNITPYVYGGKLNSFDVTINNAAYVALLGTVGNSPIGFQFMTRDITPNGQLRIHVDVPVELGGSGSITITLLASQGGTVTCMSTISFGIQGLDQSVNPPAPTTGGGTVTTTPPAPPVPPKPLLTPGPSTSATSGTATVNGGVLPTSGTLGAALNGACSSIGAIQLWLILLALFIIIAVVTAIYERLLVARSQYLPASLILAPLVLLLGFWLLAATCRGTVWMPAVLLVIAAASLVAVYRNHQTIARIIELPPAKPPIK